MLLKGLCLYLFRQQLQELQLKVEEERLQRGGKKRRDLQGETAGERIRPRQAQTRPPDARCESGAQPVSPHGHVRPEPQEGAAILSPDGCFISWLTPLSKCALTAFKLARIIIIHIILLWMCLISNPNIFSPDDRRDKHCYRGCSVTVIAVL